MKNTKEDLRQLAYVDANFSINFYNCVRNAVHSDAKISDVVFIGVYLRVVRFNREKTEKNEK